jgi:hypothetical protein
MLSRRFLSAAGTASTQSYSRITVPIFAWLCAVTSVALGAIYMFAAGAPQRYILVNAAALVIGVMAASLITRAPVRNGRLAGRSTIATGVLLLATALFGVHIDGASRWITVAGIALQPGLILLPISMVQFARDRGWLASLGLTIAATALALQPDRAMAGTLAAGLLALWFRRRETPVTAALIAAVIAFAATMMRADVVPPVLFVEQVVQSAFAFHLLTGVTVAAGLLTMLAPAAAGWRARAKERDTFVVFGATWLAVIVFAMTGNYPTPLVGYGSSAILGYCLSAAVLTARRESSSIDRH